ncbi:aminodeoxychorismate synthase component I [Polaribacter reichenbachii]|uniref:Aminobenzoate synthetase n=1 Tax=Polaribacter reichenbachii TaxID=996801 RepID=A0A1B8U6K2_9FLAO|nr:anthranilate synthase component I family protein [Polaribacter reichenbachii]APZ46144.1 aminodeoxychorismate synthase component I [Polaribacter reichenbachii]AUC20006.1 aminodeoxychorismate synthase component I [Polaribacter reichenbachii]OBY67448.1 aminobenzoate synthetase [Polaribacter reichenbachii]
MQRTKQSFTVDNIENFKEQLLLWAQQFETAIWLDSNNYKQQYSSFDCILAVEEFTSIKTDYFNAFDKLEEYQSTTKDYIFGYISYDVKNDVEQLSSNNFDGLDFADLYFFQPQKLFFIKGNTVEFHYLRMVDDEIESDFEAIQKSENLTIKKSENDIKIKLRIHKDEYHQKVNKLLHHIKIGDLYEANFCQEFYAENSTINPLEVYKDLNKISEPPFAVFLKMEHQYLLSASPERYIKKEGNKIISQPIKGTAKRLRSKIDDEKIASDLSRDIKERSENVMIVDLVRNDLSKSAKKGSVKVEELCKVYSFKQVHQMISTVVAEIEETTHPVTILKDTFPMGSMTGAPKFAAMKIIEKLEETKRGLYSGTVGYITPEGDFDFNVVIRSILYNEEKKYISYSVGGAITAKSIPEKEYEECLLKAKAMRYVLLNSK